MANDVQVINNGGTDGYLRLNKKCMLSMYISNAITYVLILIAFVLMTEYARDLLGPAHDVVWTLGIVLLVLVLVYLVVAPPIYYARYRYRLTEDRVDVRYGIVVLRHIMVPIERLHQVEIHSGPINNLLGLSQVNITTAGGTASISYLETEKAEAIADRLNALVRAMLRDRERE